MSSLLTLTCLSRYHPLLVWWLFIWMLLGLQVEAGAIRTNYGCWHFKWYGGSVADGAWTSYNNIMKCNARYRKMILHHIIFIFPQAEIGLISSEISLNSTAIFLKKRYGRFVDLGQNVMKMLICFSPLNPGIEEPKVTFWVHPQTWNLNITRTFPFNVHLLGSHSLENSLFGT